MEIKTVRDAVAVQLAGCGKNVEELVVARLADAEIKERVADVVSAVSMMSGMESEQKKLEKFDIESFGADGAVVTQAYSKKRSEERAKNNKDIDRLANAVNSAFSESKWAELRKLVRS